MTAEQRPKLYLLLCVLALLLETAWMVAKAPGAGVAYCARCRTGFDDKNRSTLVPEFCRTCAEQIRSVFFPAAPYAPPYVVDESDPFLTLETTKGDVTIELFAKRAPISTQNFLRYVRARYYDGLVFHRVEEYLCVTGRFRGGYDGEPAITIPQLPPIRSESQNGLSNLIGTIALPRQDSDQDTATSDFHFNFKENRYLDAKGTTPQLAGYAVFGQVVKGWEVMAELRVSPIASLGPGLDKAPRDPFVIKRVIEVPAPILGSISAIGTRSETR